MATDTKLKIVVDAENRTQGVFNQLERNLDAIKKSHSGLISTMQTVGMVGTAAFGGLSAHQRHCGAGAGFEQTQIAFETMLGSATSRKRPHRPRIICRSDPLRAQTARGSIQASLAYGLTARRTVPTLEMLGNISAGVGMDKLPQLILAFGQVKAATQLTGMELAPVFRSGRAPPWRFEHFNVTAAESSRWSATARWALPTYRRRSGPSQAKVAASTTSWKNSRTLAGVWSNFKDQISLTARVHRQELLPYLKPLVEHLIGVAQPSAVSLKSTPSSPLSFLWRHSALPPSSRSSCRSLSRFPVSSFSLADSPPPSRSSSTGPGSYRWIDNRDHCLFSLL